MTPRHSKQQQKRACRKRLREQRRSLDAATVRNAVVSMSARLQSIDAWTRARTVGMYLAIDGEVPTHTFAEQAHRAGKRIYLPTIEHKQLVFRCWSPGEPLITNRHGISEPHATADEAEALDVLLMPVVGWAVDGTRLGMGGGFYDRFLADRRTFSALRLGLAFESQRDDSLIELREPWDQALQGLLTEQDFYVFADRAP